MLCARFLTGLSLVVSIAAIGCGSNRIDDPVAIITDFRRDKNAAKQKYQGKPVRLKLDEIKEVSESERGTFVNGQVGRIIVWASVVDAAEAKQAAALKVGESVTLQGEIIDVISDVPATGMITLRPAKVAP
jgi:hypothetical protein